MEENKNCGCGCGCNDEHDDHKEDTCGCGHDHGDEEEQLIYVTFEDEDQEVPCVVLNIFECEGKEYIALAPKESIENDDEAEILFYRFSEDEEGVNLDDIESDEEWDKVATVFDEEFFGFEEGLDQE